MVLFIDRMTLESARGSVVLKHGEVAHCLRIYRGTPQAELLFSVRELFDLKPSQSVQFFNEDGVHVFFSSWVSEGSRFSPLER